MDLPNPDIPLYLQHPFTTGDFTVPTPAIRSIYAEVEMAVAQRYKGMAFEGPSCHGKTFASVAIWKQFAADHAEPTFWFTARSPKGRTFDREKALWGNLLGSFGYPYNGMSAENRAKTVIQKIRTKCDGAGKDRALLLVDEANELGEDQLVFLKQLRNELLTPTLGLPVSLTIVLFGTEKMKSTCNSLLNDGEAALYSRFFMRYQPFPGVRSAPELCEVLNVLDSAAALEQPLGSGVCTTQFFFPQAWQNGWRMEKEAERLWRVMDAHFPQHRDLDVGMEAVTEVLKAFLKLFAKKDAANFAGTDESWTAALKASLFLPLVHNVRSA